MSQRVLTPCDGASSDSRRRVLRVGAAAAVGTVALLSAGCGFQLRRTPVLPFRSVALVGFASDSPLAEALRRALREGDRLTEHPARADAVLQALSDRRERVVVTSTASGQVRELQLRVRLEFRVSTPSGRQLLAPSELVLSRDMNYSETAALAKEQEQAQLYRAMDDDIAHQVLRRLAALPLAPAPAASSPAAAGR